MIKSFRGNEVALFFAVIIVGVFVSYSLAVNNSRLVSFSPESINQGLVAYYTFDDDVGDAVFDSSGNDKHGAIVGSGEVSREPGKFGSGLDFAANSNNNVKITGLHSDDQTYSVSLWLKPRNVGMRQLFVTYGGNICTQYWSMNDNGEFYYSHGNSPFSYANFVGANTKAVNGTWIHLTTTFDGTTIKTYVNGALIKSVASSVPYSTTGDTYFGGTCGVPWYGAIDEVRIYDRVLTASEVDEIFKGTTSGGSTTPPPATSGNLIVNGDFSSSTDSWSFSAAANSNWNWAVDTTYSDESLVLSNKGSNEFAYQEVNLVGGKDYNLSADVLKQGQPDSKIRIQDSAWNFVDEISVSDTSNSFDSVSKTFTAPTSGLYKIVLINTNSPDWTFTYFDNIELVEVSVPPISTSCTVDADCQAGYQCLDSTQGKRCGVSFSFVPDVDGNLIGNGKFQNPLIGTHDNGNWGISSSANANNKIEILDVGGNKFLSILGFGFATQEVDLEPGKVYNFSSQVSATTGAEPRLLIQYDNWITLYDIYPDASQGLLNKSFSFTFSVPQDGLYRVSLVTTDASVDNGLYTFYDDVILKEISSTVPVDNPTTNSKGFACIPFAANGNPLPARTRVQNTTSIYYCDPVNLNYLKVKNNDAQCLSDFECNSNACIDGKCTSIRESLDRQTSLLTKIFCVITNIDNLDDVLRRNVQGQNLNNNEYLKCIQEESSSSSSSSTGPVSVGETECEINSQCSSGEICENGKCAISDAAQNSNLRIFVSSTSFTNNAGIVAADALCNSDSNKPSGTHTYKALLGVGTRYAWGIDWPLQANTNYYRSDGTTLIDITNSNAWFTFPLTNSISTSSTPIVTGLDVSGKANFNCAGWTNNSATLVVDTGIPNKSDTGSMTHGISVCSTSTNIYCVEQP